MKRILALAAVLLGSVTAPAQAPKAEKPLPADLALVPNDAFAFAHVKLADLWKDDALKDVRDILHKAGPKAIEAFDSRFTPAPTSVERLTVYMPTPNFDNGPRDFNFVFILKVSKPFDRNRFLKQLGKTEARKGRNAGYFVDEDESVGVRFVDDTTLVFGTVASIQQMVDNAAPQKPGPLTPALQIAAGTRPVVASVNVTALPAEIVEEVLTRHIPEPLHPLFKAQSLTLSMDLVKDGNIYALVHYGDRNAADAAEKALGIAVDLAKTWIADTRKQLAESVFGDGKQAKIDDLPEAAISLLGLGALQHAEDILKTNPIKRDGEAFTASIALPPHFKSLFSAAAVAGSMMAPAVGKLKEASARIQSTNNLKQIALAAHNYHNANNAFPSAAIVDKKGKALLSWRVAILPYIEQDALYREFKLDEPWDSEHNMKLIERMPKTYALPNKLSKPGRTHYRVFVGGDAAWDWIQGGSFAAITDGTSNTLMAVEAEEGVPWTKPEELDFDPMKDLPKMGNFFKKDRFHAAFFDGSVRSLPIAIDANTLRALITKSGGEVVQIPD